MDLSYRALTQCETAIRREVEGSWRRKLLRLPRARSRDFAADCVAWTADAYRSGIVTREAMREHVREKASQEYGSIWVMILFSVAWKLIEMWLFP